MLGRYDAGKTHLIPHYLQYWPHSFAGSVGWQILSRSVGVSASDWPSVAEAASAFAQTGCHCYPRMYGGHSAWMPTPNGGMPYSSQPQRRVADFRSALSASVGVPPPEKRILFQVRRNGIRQIANEASLRAAATAALGDAVRFVAMEELPLMQQYRLISSSRSLAGMHGQGLAWSMLLASDQANPYSSSCLEIVGKWPGFKRLDYHSNSAANSVHYVRLVQENAPECEIRVCKRCSYRNCGNVTVSVEAVVKVLRKMVDRLTPVHT